MAIPARSAWDLENMWKKNEPKPDGGRAFAFCAVQWCSAVSLVLMI